MQHSELAQGRWYTMTLAQQLGNVGSEYERALKWKQKNDSRFEVAFGRFLGLLDLTISNQKLTVTQRQELLRVRESACEELTIDGKHNDYLQRYFYYFALAARGRF